MIMSIVYETKNTNSRYEGVRFNMYHTKKYLKTKVSKKYYDEEGTQKLIDFTSIQETGFSTTDLEKIFSVKPVPKNWKIGECLAECYLEDDNQIRIPYESSRDAKNPNGNLHGADIVGFSELEGKTVFVFGEVKTSSDPNAPPSVMNGKSGMNCQLENIMNDDDTKELLIRWLCFKVMDKDDSFQKDFKNAFVTYYNSKKKKLKLVGILIRDVEPSRNDLKSRYEKFTQKLNSEMFLNLTAIYIPIPIKNLKNYIQRVE